MAAWCAENLRSLADWRAEGFNFSTASDETVKMYDAAVRQLISLRECEQLGGFGGTMGKMLEADPKAIMPRVFKCTLDAIVTRPSAQTVEEIANLQQEVDKTGTDWERSHVKALALLGEGNMTSAIGQWDRILEKYPTDPFALKIAADGYFWLGDGENVRACMERILPKWGSSTPCYSFLHGMYAFGLEETGSYIEAEKQAKKALELNRFDGWATHANVHVLEMTERYQQGIDFLEKTAEDWTGGFLLTHTLWHKALFYVTRGDYEAALSLYDTEMEKNIEASKALLSAVDATALLLRLEMEGVDVGDRWKRLPDMSVHAEGHALPFSDCHLPAFYLRRGEVEVERKAHDSLVNQARNATSELGKIAELVGLQVFEGVEAYLNERYDTAVEKIYPLRDQLHQIGGSNAQRDLFSQLLINSCILSEQARHWKLTPSLLEERAFIRLGTSSVSERLSLRFRERHPL